MGGRVQDAEGTILEQNDKDRGKKAQAEDDGINQQAKSGAKIRDQQTIDHRQIQAAICFCNC